MSHTGLGSGREMGPGSEEGAHGLFPTSSCNAKAGVATERRGKEKCVSRPEDGVSHLRNRQLRFHRGKLRWPLGISDNARLLIWALDSKQRLP